MASDPRQALLATGTRSRGEITRVVNDYVAYVHDEKQEDTLSFTPAVVTEYHGESFAELCIVEGQSVEFVRQPDATISHLIRPTRKLISDDRRCADYIPGRPDPRHVTKSPQIELQEQDPAQGDIPCYRALPRPTRTFGKLLNTQQLQAGDLMLTRERTPDALSHQIIEVQQRGGYAPEDARWTHAALYLGDDMHVVEATVDANGGNVRMTSLDDYCQGSSVLRFRRPRYLTPDRNREAWKFCIRALSRLRQGYSIAEAARIWFKVMVRGMGFYGDVPIATNKAIMCSTFYSDAFNEATGLRLSEMNGAVVPAWLSVSDQFDEIETHWLRIV